MGLVVEVRLSCCLVLLSTDRKAGRQDGRASTTQPMYSTDYALMKHLGHHRLCEHACSLLIWEWARADRHSPGSPSPLTGLRLWQDPVTGGWPGVVHGCVLLSPCDHARLLVVLSIYYLIYCNYDCALVMMNIIKTYGWDVPQKLVSFLAEILLPWSPFVNIVHSCSKVIGFIFEMHIWSIDHQYFEASF